MSQYYYHPSRQEIRIIRNEAGKIARRWSSVNSFKMMLGIRVNTKQERGQSFNILKVSDHPHWLDTDIFDKREWRAINHVPITDDGRAMVDIFIYEPCEGALVCNVQAEFDRNGLKAIHADDQKNEWVRTC